MKHTKRETYSDPDWTIRGAHFDFGLSAVQPFVARSVVHARPTTTKVSVHEGHEVLFLLRGSVKVHFEGHVMSAGRGEVCLISMWEPHVWRVTSPNTEQFTVIFLPAFLAESTYPDKGLLNPFSSPPRHRPRASEPETRKLALEIGKELRGEAERKHRGWETAVRLGVQRLLFSLCRDWKPPPHARRPSPSGSLDIARIMPALKAIHARPEERVSLAKAAAACNLSTPHFSRIFRQMMRLSFARFRLRARLTYAAQLLLTTELPTDAIAAQSGFVDASHLHRNFVKQFGTTPGEYRKQGR